MPNRMTKRSVVGLALLTLGGLSTAQAAAEESTTPQPPLEFETIPGEVLVGFTAPPAPQLLDRIEAAVSEVTGWHAPYPYPGSGNPHQALNRGPSHPLAVRRKAHIRMDADPWAVADRIAGIEGVAWASPNGRTGAAFIPNDPRYGQQYGPKIVGAEAAWDILPGGSNAVVLAVADSGLNFPHEDFQDDAVWINQDEIPGNNVDDDQNGFVDDVRGWDFMNFDNDPSANGSHGSHVAGIAAARTDNRTGIAGMAGNVKIMPLQVFNGGGGTWEAIENAIIYATDNGAHLLNYSGGGGGGTPGLAAAVQYAHANGMTVVCAAGNHNSSTPFYPAAYPDALAISGTDSRDQRYTSSAFGNWIDVAAPAVVVYSCLASGPASYGNMTGTSMASPHVAGLVALMYSINPHLTPDEVRQRLRDQAVDLGAPGFDPQFGWGRIDAFATVQDVWQNGGCPNLESHVIKAKGDKSISTLQTAGAAGGKAGVVCTSGDGSFSKKKRIRQDGSARVKVKGLPDGAYVCSVNAIHSAEGQKLCTDEVRPLAVTIGG
ncbi:MAG: hypothetical protein C4547_10365 [Phycisphaerales bacterium]|nr:MAG: hypothetical protein C4547_10365 [Phycisphaerales bacterium]